MAAYNAYFEITNQGGNLFSHSEKFLVQGLSKVRIQEDKNMFWSDWSGTVQRFYARSGKPFAVVVTKKGWTESSDGSVRDTSEVRVILAGAEVTDH